jgi:hypothetical protein
MRIFYRKYSELVLRYKIEETLSNYEDLQFLIFTGIRRSSE